MKVMKFALALVTFAVVAPLTVYATEDRANGGAVLGAAAEVQSHSVGVVKKVDLEQSKITISHGPIANLGMPAMTMVFRVGTPSLLTRVKVDDKVSFVAEKVNGAFTVLSLVRTN